MPNSVIEEHATIRYSIVGEDAIIRANAKIGDNPEFYDKNEWGITVVGKDKEVPKNFILGPKEVY